MADLKLNSKEKEFIHYKKQRVEIAKDLRYPKEVIEKIRKAKTEREISRILKECRLKGD